MGLVEFPPPSARNATKRAVAAASPGQGARRIGTLILIAGLVAAGLVYWIGTHRREPAIEDLIPNYSAANSRQMGLMYGHSGELMWEGVEALKQPGTQAVVLVIIAGLAAAVCFRIAWLDEDHAKDPHTRSPL